MLSKQSWPQAGKADSPGIAVPVVVVNDDFEEVDDIDKEVVFDTDDEEVGVEEELVFEIAVEEVKVVGDVVFDVDVEKVEEEEEIEVEIDVDEAEEDVFDDDEEVNVAEEVVVDEESDNEVAEVEVLDTLVVKPSKAFAQTTVPSGPTLTGTTVCPPVRSKEVTSINAPPPMYEEQTAPAPGRTVSSKFGAIRV
jgi:hypothetical protein